MVRMTYVQNQRTKMSIVEDVEQREPLHAVDGTAKWKTVCVRAKSLSRV